MTAEGDRVVAEWTSKAKTVHGGTYDNRRIGISTVRDGKITSVVEYTMAATALEFEVSGDLVPADGAEAVIGVHARRGGGGGLEPHHGQYGAVQYGVSFRVDRIRGEGPDAGDRGQRSRSSTRSFQRRNGYPSSISP